MEGLGTAPLSLELRKAGTHGFGLAKEELGAAWMQPYEVDGHMPDLRDDAAAIGLAIPLGYLVRPTVEAARQRLLRDVEDRLVPLLPGFREFRTVFAQRVLLKTAVGKIDPPSTQQGMTAGQWTLPNVLRHGGADK